MIFFGKTTSLYRSKKKAIAGLVNCNRRAIHRVLFELSPQLGLSRTQWAKKHGVRNNDTYIL
jgi:hypothetical protein